MASERFSGQILKEGGGSGLGKLGWSGLGKHWRLIPLISQMSDWNTLVAAHSVLSNVF